MITLIIEAKIKQEYLNEYLNITQMIREKCSVQPGCYKLSYYQNNNSPCEFRIVQQWASQDNITSHHAKLVSLLGPPPPGGTLPEALLNMHEEAAVNFYTQLD